MLGGGVKVSKSENKLYKFLKKFNLPVITTWSGVDLIESNNSKYIGNVGVYGSRAANFTVQNSDLLLCLGSRLDTRITGGVPKTFARKSKVIAVDIDKNELRKVLNNIGVRSLNRLLEEIGLGLRVGNIVAQQITGFLKENHSVKQKELVPLEITGSEGLIVNYAVCCKPIPGDSVIGHFTAERGLVIHQERCKNILSVREDPQQCFPVNWGEPSGRSFTAQIKVVARDEPGLLANLASVITSQEANIASIQTMEINTGMHEFVLDLEVSDRLHLSKILRKIRTLNNIVSVSRIHDWEMRQASALH